MQGSSELAGQYDAPLYPLLERFCEQDEAAQVLSPINVTDAPGGPERWSMSCLRNLAAEESRAPTKGNEGLPRLG